MNQSTNLRSRLFWVAAAAFHLGKTSHAREDPWQRYPDLIRSKGNAARTGALNTTTTTTPQGNGFSPRSDIGGGGDDAAIVYGEPALVGEFPGYAVANRQQTGSFCGAHLIYEDILLTAAHCYGLWKGYTTFIGSTLLNGNDATDKIVGDLELVHPHFSYFTLQNDVLLVRLVSPSAAPPAILNDDPAVPADDALLAIVGFGGTEDGDVSPILLTAESRVISNAECKTRAEAVFGPDAFFEDGMMCDFGDNEESTSYGDSGSPVFDKSTGSVVGLVSWGPDPVNAPIPFSVNTRVSAYYDWIQSGICALSSNPPPDCIVDEALWFGNSVPALPDEFPFYVQDRDAGYCSGILVAPDVVLVAASCGPDVFLDFGVYIGITSESELGDVEQSEVQSFTAIKGAGLVSGTQVNDLALLKLSSASTKGFAQLALTSPAEGSVVTKMGFGNDYGLNSPVLRKVDLRVSNRNSCAADFDEVGATTEKLLIDLKRKFCAGPADDDACIQEIGGPLVDENGYLVGLSSSQFGCPFFGLPSSSTDVAYYAQDLYMKICALSDDPPRPICDEFLPIPRASPSAPPIEVPRGSPVAVPTKSPTKAPPSAPIPCFSKHTEVEVFGQGKVRMEALKIGDAVRSTDGGFTTVYSFGHYDSHRATDFLQLWTAAAHLPLEVTSDHLLLVQQQGPSDKPNVKLLPASEVQVGDRLVAPGLEGLSDAARITSIATVTRVGLYSPFTRSGNIVVNGVAASNYIALPPVFHALASYEQQHWLQHLAYSPYRQYCRAFGCHDETYDETTGLSKAVLVWLPLLRVVEYVVLGAAHNTVVLLFSAIVAFLYVVWTKHTSRKQPQLMAGKY